MELGLDYSNLLDILYIYIQYIYRPYSLMLPQIIYQDYGWDSIQSLTWFSGS